MVTYIVTVLVEAIITLGIGYISGTGRRICVWSWFSPELTFKTGKIMLKQFFHKIKIYNSNMNKRKKNVHVKLTKHNTKF